MIELNKDTGKYSDAELLVLFRGDKTEFDLAFLNVYTKYSNKVYFYILKILGDEDSAKDAFQETFIRFSDKVKKETDILSFQNYLIKVARNICIDIKNSRKMSEFIDLDLVNLEDYGYNVDVTSENEKMELISYIDSCLDLLDDDEKEIVICRQFQGLSYDEIVEITGINSNNARLKFFRAKEKLKNLLLPYLSKD